MISHGGSAISVDEPELRLVGVLPESVQVQVVGIHRERGFDGAALLLNGLELALHRRGKLFGHAGQLQRDGLISYERGHISVLDRPAIERRVCECYAVVKKEYDRLLPDIKAT